MNETRWFTTKTGKVWHALTTGDRAMCRANIRPNEDAPVAVGREIYAPNVGCEACKRKLAERDAAPASGPKTCGTLGCALEATHTLTYTFPESRDQVETDVVCEFCGDAYARRPSFRASLTPIARPDYDATMADTSGPGTDEGTPRLSWREAREALTATGRGVNDAQDILDDLAHWGVGSDRALSYYATGGGVRWLSYAGTDDANQPVYAATKTRPGAL